MIFATLPKRGADSYGDGSYQAPRGGRKHKGIDYACFAETVIYTPVNGFVTKLGYPYDDDLDFDGKPDFTYVEVTTPAGLRHRIFYITQEVKLGQRVDRGITRLGVSQTLQVKYPVDKDHPGGIIDHVHYEILMMNGQPLDPEGSSHWR